METQQLRKVLNIKDDRASKWIGSLNDAMKKFDITTSARQAFFIAQVAHESECLASVTENLNYSAEGLRKIFGKYFKTDAEAQKFARKPEQIANRVYANRMENGDENSGDGWQFRGRGLIQLTGRKNYKRCGIALGIDLLANPDLLATPQYAALSAAWFWSDNGLNVLADDGDFVAATRLINGGLNGLDDRQHLFDAASEVLAV